MKKIVTLLCFLTAAGAFAASPSEIDRAAAAMAGKEASFVQQFTPKGFKNSQSESGTVLFGALPQMRWSYSKPEQKLFVFDGHDSWFYIPADKQVTAGTVDDSRRKELPFLVIGDPQAREKLFTITQQAKGDAVVTTLQPRDKAAMIRNVVVTIGAADHLIRSIGYTDREGNRTLFQLSGYHQGSPSADAFRFTPPAGVQVVKAE
jgi:outer membrane lipoprotein carrier protein